jgi:hypothetical protein
MAKKPRGRELINLGTDKRYVRRDENGHFKESDDVGRSLAADRRQPAEHDAAKGQGDRGDQKAPASRLHHLERGKGSED